jgi:hypothetical protein
MIDKTTEGFTAEPEEVEAVLHNLCGYHLSEHDPALRYTALTREQVLYDALVAAIRRERGRALADLVAAGQSMTQIAQATNLRTRQRVQRLIAVSKAAEEAVAQVRAASRDFQERLAAVEATLDEVVGGLPGVTPQPPATASPQADPAPTPAPAAVDPGPDIAAVDAQAVAAAPLNGGTDIDVDMSAALTESTRAMPALAAVLHPTKELPSDEPRWWRRVRDTGAA